MHFVYKFKNLARIVLFVVFQLFVFSLFAQESNWKLLHELKVTADFFEVDALGNVYTIKNNTLSKFIIEGNAYKRVNYDYNFYGNISSVDVTNPFQLLIYYSDFQTIVSLDKYLAEINKPISIHNFGNVEFELICNSSEGGFWAFEGFSQTLKYYDSFLHESKTSLDFRTLFDETLTPCFMRESNNRLYINTLEGVFFVFDVFANLEKTLSLNIENDFAVQENLVYYSDKKIKIYDFKSLEISEIDLSWKKNILSAKIEQKKLYIFTPECISIFVQNK